MWKLWINTAALILTFFGAPEILASTANGKNSRNLTVCSIIESGDPKFMIDYNRIAAALDIAVEHANEMVLPPAFKLVRLHKNSSKVCDPVSPATSRVMEWLREGVDCNVYIGPGCTEAALDVYKLVKFLDKVQIGCPAPAISARTGLPRTAFPNLLRTSYTAVSLGRALTTFLDYFSYSHTSIIIHRNDPFYSELGDNLRDFLLSSRLDLFTHSGLLYVTNNNYTDNASMVSDDLLRSTLQEANSSSRVIVVFASADVLRRILVMATQIGMVSGQHVYIAVDLFPSDSWGRFVWTRGDQHDREIRTAFKSLLILSMTEESGGYTFEGDFAKSVRHLALEKYGYHYGPVSKVDPIVMGYYEAVILYATGVRRLYDTAGNVTDASSLLNVMRNSSVLTPLRTFVNLTSSGDKNIVFDMKVHDQDEGVHQPFARVDPGTGNIVWLSASRWPARTDGVFPPDVPLCGYSGMECKTDQHTTIIVALSVGIILVFGAIAVGVMYYILVRRNSALPAFWWRYRLNELQFSNTQLSSSKLTSSAHSSRLTKASIFTTICPWKTASLHGSAIGLKPVAEKAFRPTADIVHQMNQVQPLRHVNLQRFIGLCVDDASYIVYILGEFCQKGCLDDLLEQKSLVLDWSFKYSLINDLAEGMQYMHNSPIQSHGFLTSVVCLVDSRLSIKISDYGVTKIRDAAEFAGLTKDYKARDYMELLWRAPELLKITMPERGSQKGDVYSFAIILQQVILRCGPYESPGNTVQLSDAPLDLLTEICSNTSSPVRPPVPRSAASTDLLALMEICWSEFPVHRPSFHKIKESVRKMGGITGGNLVDHLLKRMEKYALDLEEQVAIKTQQFMDEKLRCEDLLNQMLPQAVAQSLIRGDSVPPEFFHMVTVYFSDVVGFTNIAASGTPMDVISLLNDLYTRFDHVVEKHDAYKIETIGDAYMVASGLPVRNGDLHVKEVALVAREILAEVGETMIPQRPNDSLKIRSGLHSGSCVAGIIGIKAPRYCLFGDSINVASRMESTGEAMKIQTTQASTELLQLWPEFSLILRGQVEVKGKGLMTTYWRT